MDHLTLFLGRLYPKRQTGVHNQEHYAEDNQDDKEPFLADKEISMNRYHGQIVFQSSRGIKYLAAFNIFILVITLMLNGPIAHLWMLPGKNAAVKKTSYFCKHASSMNGEPELIDIAPILETTEIKLHEVRLNGTLWPSSNPAFSRLEPGPEAEAVWESFELIDTFPLSRQEILALGKDPETAVRYPEEHWRMGPDVYIGSLDVQHKLHCLNELRRMAFADFGELPPTKKRHGKLWWIHLRHCVDILTQDMICHADADIVTYNWMDTQHHPFPDFSINRKCRNLNTLFEWRDKRKVNMVRYMEMKKPLGVKQIPAEPGYYEMFGFDGSDLYPKGEGYP